MTHGNHQEQQLCLGQNLVPIVVCVHMHMCVILSVKLIKYTHNVHWQSHYVIHDHLLMSVQHTNHVTCARIFHVIGKGERANLVYNVSNEDAVHTVI